MTYRIQVKEIRTTEIEVDAEDEYEARATAIDIPNFDNIKTYKPKKNLWTTENTNDDETNRNVKWRETSLICAECGISMNEDEPQMYRERNNKLICCRCYERRER